MGVSHTVEGMSCGGCERTVEKALKGVEGVESVTVDWTTKSATVNGQPDPVALVTAVEDAGYTAHV